MSSGAKEIVEKFNRLPRQDKLAVYEAIAREVSSADYAPLSDDELTAIAAETFALLDEEEKRGGSR